MRFTHKYVGIIFLAALLGSMLSCSLFENTSRRVTREQHYLFSPETVLQSLTEGKQGVFTTIDSEPENLASDDHIKVHWGQSDFFQVLEAIHIHVWNEPLDTWKLNYMSFTIPCNQVGEGFWGANFSFFKEERTIQGTSQIEHRIDIYPNWNLINASEFRYGPGLVGWKTVDINEIEIPSEKALMIAEKNGGKERRTTAKNTCDVSVMLSPNSVDYQGWDIIYSSDTYSISVDPVTGKVVNAK